MISHERHVVSDHQPFHCLTAYADHIIGTFKSALLALCEGDSSVTDEFPTLRASNAEKAFYWWCHHGLGRNTARVANQISKQKEHVNTQSRRFELLRRASYRTFKRVSVKQNIVTRYEVHLLCMLTLQTVVYMLTEETCVINMVNFDINGHAKCIDKCQNVSV